MGLRIQTSDDVAALFRSLAALDHEVIGLAYLAGDGLLLGVRHCLAGSAVAAEVPLRAIARDAMMLGAVRVVMAHNHPSGDPAPSRADRAITRRLARVLDALGTPLVEHLVLARGGGRSSFAEAGLV